jgi:Flp pilus assembly pilin Flp
MQRQEDRVEWLRAEEGQDLAEYALLMMLIAVALIAAVGLVGDELSQAWTAISAGLADAPWPF